MLNISYHHEGDYLIPDLIPPESPNIGIWGMRRRDYLRKHHDGLYTGMLLSGKLNAHLEEISLVLLLPYYPYSHDTNDFDATFYPPGMESVPKSFAIVRANEHMIRSANYLICYDRGQIGKTRDFVELARQRERKGLIHIENLSEKV